MRKQVFGRKLKRDVNERKALFRGLLNDLVLKEKIKTTEEKAKAIRGLAEKLVTKAKIRGAEARMVLSSHLNPLAVEKAVNDLAVRFAKRPGGYTRIVKLGARFSDNAKMALIEWVEKSSVSREKAEAKVTEKVEAVLASEKAALKKQATRKEAPKEKGEKSKKAKSSKAKTK